MLKLDPASQQFRALDTGYKGTYFGVTGNSDVVLVFDYRRYQSRTLRLTSAVKSRYARVVLFTDIYASPLREMADLIRKRTPAG